MPQYKQGGRELDLRWHRHGVGAAQVIDHQHTTRIFGLKAELELCIWSDDGNLPQVFEHLGTVVWPVA